MHDMLLGVVFFSPLSGYCRVLDSNSGSLWRKHKSYVPQIETDQRKRIIKKIKVRPCNLFFPFDMNHPI